jgi:hypothetical protein
MMDEAIIRLQVEAELRDPKYLGRDHHDNKLYVAGCRGPLCRKASRDYGRELYRARNEVAPDALHKPTVRTKWDALLETFPTKLEQKVSA